jgi:hypothetical protein
MAFWDFLNTTIKYVGNIYEGGKKIIGNVYEGVKKGKNFMDKIGYKPEELLYDINKWSKGYMTLPGGYKYTGPFNPMDLGAPKNETDRAGYIHDAEYGAIRRAIDNKTLKNKDEIRKAVKEADNRFYDILDNAPEYTDPNAKIIDKIGNRLGYYGIKAKELGQDLGFIKPDAFVSMKKGGLLEKRPKLKYVL